MFDERIAVIVGFQPILLYALNVIVPKDDFHAAGLRDDLGHTAVDFDENRFLSLGTLCHYGDALYQK
jgi:hypothetical protein